MTTAYTSLLGLALPVTGELSGTWGSVVNDSITSLLDSAIAGTTNVSTDADVTLTTTTGAANTAREAILLFSGARTALRTVTAPAQSKIYTVINATTGGYAVKLVGSGPTTGLTIPNGASAVVAWNGSDFVEVGAGSIGNLIVNGTLTVTGATTLQSTLAVTGVSTLTAGAVIQGLTVGRGAGAVSTNTAVGASALAANTTGLANTTLGYQAGQSITTGLSNTAIGYQANRLNVTGDQVTAVGSLSLSSNTASANTAVGFASANSNTSGANNTALGFYALYSNTTASNNTAVGYQAGYANTTGTSLVYVGYQTGKASTTADNNTAVGDRSLQATTTGAGNTALGGLTLQTNTTGASNTAIGLWSLFSNTTANNNTATGYFSMRLNTTGAENVANGMLALESNTTGGNNVAIGSNALNKNTTASNNTAVGYQAGYSNTTGASNTFIGGRGAGYSCTTGNENTFVGDYSGRGVTTGSSNSFIGQYSGAEMSTGSKNTIIGKYSGNQGGLDIRTASNNIVLSDGDGNPKFVHNHAAGATSLPGTSGAYNSSTGTFDSTLQIGSTLQLMSYAVGANTQVQLASNTYFNSGYKAIAGGAGASKLYVGAAGIFEFAGSAVLTNAGDPITYTKTLDCGGLGYSIALQNATSLAGTGITFPATQNASSNANTLDDYEEGTWTPTVTGIGGGALTLNTKNATYVKIGKIVNVFWEEISWTANSGLSANVQIGGLPFISANGLRSSTGGFGGSSAGSMTFTGVLQTALDAGYTQCWVIYKDPTNNTYSHTPTFASSGVIYGFSLTYQTNN